MSSSRVLFLCVSLLGCTQDPTQFVVVVDSDMSVPEDLVQIQARIRTLEGGLLASSDFSLAADEFSAGSTQFALPLSFGVLRPENEAFEKLIIEVRALGVVPGTGLDTLFTRSAVTTFVEGKSLLLPMFLAGQCRTLDCPSGQTCTENGCLSESITPNRLKESTGGQSDLVIGRGNTSFDPLPVQDGGMLSTNADSQLADGGSNGGMDATAGLADSGPSLTPGGLYIQTAPVAMRWRYSAPTGIFFSERETTTAQFSECISNSVCQAANFRSNSLSSDCHLGNALRNNHPINCVSWYGADEFCSWVGGRLPTESEVEAEASNNGTRLYPWGNTPAANCDYSVMNDSNAGGTGCGNNRTDETCAKPMGKSVSGLCDMSGNVWEWTSTVIDNFRVTRGGSWYDDDQELLKSTGRFRSLPANMSNLDGFRCVRNTAP